MKYLFSLFILLIPFLTSAQDLKIESELLFELNEGVSYCFDADKVYLRPEIIINATKGTAIVNALLVNELEESLMSIGSVSYGGQTIGEKSQFVNFDEVKNFESKIEPIMTALRNIDAEISNNKKLLNVEGVDNVKVTETIFALEKVKETYSERAANLADDFVQPVWSYNNTFALFKTELFDWESQALTSAGISNLLEAWISVPNELYSEENETFSSRYKFGQLKSYFNNTPIIRNFTAGGNYFIEDGCFVLGEGQVFRVKSKLPNQQHTIGRSTCKGRTNNNGDALIVSGKVLSSSGLSYSDGIYTIDDDDFSITVDGDATLLKVTSGQFMKFEVSTSASKKR